ncbi:MarR family winged helix-turn-helix transcriptional regulator [bacterium]|nr:MarR family winged helix-turn-helix transcriptional regulator [bacterium]
MIPISNKPRHETIGAIDDLLREFLEQSMRPQMPASQDMNVTMGQMHCLGAIAHLGKPSMSEVAAELHVHPSTVTVLVDGLVSHGLVRRWGDPSDRRVVRVEETAKGRKNHQRHMAESRAQLEAVLSSLSNEDLERLRESLLTLRKAAQEYARAHGRTLPGPKDRSEA